MSALRKTAGASRREANKADKRARILAAARELFATRGFEGTTTREVAARADVAAGTLFLYAATKEQLLFLLFSEEVERIQQARFASVPGGAPLEDQLLHVFDGFLRYYARDRALARVFLQEQLFLQGPLLAQHLHLVLGFLGRLAGLIAAAQERRELAADVEPLQLGQNLFALYLTAVIGLVGGHHPTRRAAHGALRASIALSLRGLAAPVARRSR